MEYKDLENNKEKSPIKTNVNIVKPNKVRFELKGILYIELNDKIGQVIPIKNKYDHVPKFVILAKRKNGEWYIKNEKKRS